MRILKAALGALTLTPPYRPTPPKGPSRPPSLQEAAMRLL